MTSIADQEFLASFAVEIDEGGVSRLQSVLEKNRELADSLSAAFSAATSAIQAFREELGGLPSFSSGITEVQPGAGALTLGLNTEEAQRQLESFIALAKKPVSLSANASGIVSAARLAYESVRSIFSAPLSIRAKVQAGGDAGGDDAGAAGETVKMSTGGRFTKPTDVQVAEDGDAEYIIPVKKENRAVPLLRQLLAELSPSARQSLANSEFGIQNSELSPAGGIRAGLPSGAQITQNNSNVSAPVSIQVHASGANAERIGESVYNTAERYLLRTLKGVFA